MAPAFGNVAALGSWKRRNYLVDRGFQLKYALLMAAAVGIVAVSLGLWLQQSHQYALAVAGLDYIGQRAMESSYRLLFVAFAGVAALAAVGFGWLGVRMTHRVAGPAMMMRRYLTSVAVGRYPLVRLLRKSDELSELFVTVAAAIEQVRERDVRQVELIEDAIIAMSGAAERAPELLPIVERLQREVDERRAAFEAKRSTAAPPTDPR